MSSLDLAPETSGRNEDRVRGEDDDLGSNNLIDSPLPAGQIVQCAKIFFDA